MNMGDILSKKIDRNGIYNNIVNHKIKKGNILNIMIPLGFVALGGMLIYVLKKKGLDE